jgi:hypothetical protein
MSWGSRKQFMVKYLLNFLCIFLFLSSLSFAKEAFDEAFLQKEFGDDLSHAPFFLRFAFNKEFNKDWGKSDYLERKIFLTNYETGLAVEQVKEKTDAKAAAAQEKERYLATKEALLKEKERLKAQEAEEKAEKLAEEKRQKEFDQATRKQQQELEQMEQQATQGNN